MKELLNKPYREMNNALDGPLRFFFSPIDKPGRIITKPNMVSLSRIPLGFVVAYMLAQGLAPWPILVVFLTAAITDLVDGVAARIEGATRLGAFVDAWCDKIFLAPVVWQLHTQMWRVPFWILAGIEVFLFVVPFLALGKPKIDPRSVIWGKAKFTAECLAVVAFVFQWPLVGNVFLAFALPLAGMSMKDKGWEIIQGFRDH